MANNGQYYSNLLSPLPENIKAKRYRKLPEGVLYYEDNVDVHMYVVMVVMHDCDFSS